MMLKIRDMEFHQLRNLSNLLHVRCEESEHLLMFRLRAKLMVATCRLLDRYQKALDRRLLEQSISKRDRMSKQVERAKFLTLSLDLHEALMLYRVLCRINKELIDNDLILHYTRLVQDLQGIGAVKSNGEPILFLELSKMPIL